MQRVKRETWIPSFHGRHPDSLLEFLWVPGRLWYRWACRSTIASNDIDRFGVVDHTALFRPIWSPKHNRSYSHPNREDSALRWAARVISARCLALSHIGGGATHVVSNRRHVSCAAARHFCTRALLYALLPRVTGRAPHQHSRAPLAAHVLEAPTHVAMLFEVVDSGRLQHACRSGILCCPASRRRVLALCLCLGRRRPRCGDSGQSLLRCRT